MKLVSGALHVLLLGTKRVLPVFLLVSSGLVSQNGCGMFDLRDPVAPPDLGPGIPSLPPNDPANVLFNFAEAVKANRDGFVQYGETLQEAFELRLDALDVIEGSDERVYLCKAADTDAQRRRAEELEGLMASSDSVSYEFGFDTPTDESDTTAYYLDIPYELQLIRSEGDSLIARGKAEIYMLKNEQLEWEISIWIDKRQDPATSFGRWHADKAVVDCPDP